MVETTSKTRRLGDWMEEPRFLNRAVWYTWKMIICLGIVGIVSVCYFTASKYTSHRHFDLSTAFDHAIPFVRWSWWIYFPGYLCGIVFCVCAFRNTEKFHKIALAIVIAQSICTIGFFLLPSTFPRPTDAGAGITGEALRWFWTVDPPNNTFPSKHVSIMTLAAIGLWIDDDNWLKWIGTLFWLGVVITVHTAKLHYLVDAVAGVSVAFFAYWLVFHWHAKRKAARVRDPGEGPLEKTARA